ncbi:unnamed protein product [Chironomus riparius]|uniref:Uncharacterized protein n=1 Tax=Chironomus riparius TaxID=315576 RepID=A0A9N9S5Z0_9DIPT|nr:unnamed protein product [Chironomus riparius]
MSTNLQKFFIIFLIFTSINSSSSIKVQCEFSIESKFTPMPYVYSCVVIRDLKVIKPGTIVDEIEGNHEVNKFNNDVAAVYLENKEMNFLLTGFTTFFPKLITMSMMSCKLKEIKQNDLKGYPNLQYLMMARNELEVLENDLFKHNKDLIYINVNENKLKKIDENIFDDLKQLNFLNLLSNDCIQMFGHGKNRVARIIKNVKEKCSERKKKVKGTGWLIFKSWIFWCCLVLVVLVIFVVAGFIVVKAN